MTEGQDRDRSLGAAFRARLLVSRTEKWKMIKVQVLRLQTKVIFGLTSNSSKGVVLVEGRACAFTYSNELNHYFLKDSEQVTLGLNSIICRARMIVTLQNCGEE